jgi:hypothetical protein
MSNIRPKTLIIDIDGTLLHHHGTGIEQAIISPTLLPGVIEKFDEWDRKGYNLILMTGRRESERKSTDKQLRDVGIVYDQLIMGVGGGDRVLINDTKENSQEPTAFGFTVKRNEGIGGLDI